MEPAVSDTGRVRRPNLGAMAVVIALALYWGMVAYFVWRLL